MNIQYFINKFNKKKELAWCVGRYRQNNKRCALGYCTHEERSRLKFLFKTENWDVALINDGELSGVRHKKIFETCCAPKARILAALWFLDSNYIEQDYQLIKRQLELFES